MVLTENPRSIDQLRPEVPRALALAVACCLEKDPARRFPSVAHLAAALEPFAPPDTRDLAARIARIAGASGGTLPTALGSSSGSRIAVAGSTAASWSGKTEVAKGPGRKIAAVAAVLTVLAIGGGLAVFLAVRPVRSHRTEVRPAASIAADGTATSSTPAAPSASAPATPASAATAAASTVAASTPGVHGIEDRSARRDAATTATAATTGTTTEPPRYRTSW